MNGRANSVVFHVLMLFFANADCRVQQREFLKLDLGNVKLLDNVLFETEANTSIQCATICKRTPWCRTVTVTSPPSATNVLCRGHSSLVTNSTVTSASWTSVWTTESGKGCLELSGLAVAFIVLVGHWQLQSCTLIVVGWFLFLVSLDPGHVFGSATKESSKLHDANHAQKWVCLWK